MNSIIDKLTDKRILIFGYGREGKSTEEYIKAHVKYRSLDIFEGKISEIDEDNYDYIIKSPGIVMLESNPKYTSQTELFLDEFSDKTIGITGTKGKSTTSSMIAHVLNSIGKKAILLGNIGKPCFDMIDEIDNDTWIVFELSCHQLLHINKAPHIAVFLNLFEEHLDYYGTMDRYFAAKANIISHQTEEDLCFVSDNVPAIEHKSKMVVIDGPSRDYELSILGEHNKINAEFVTRVVEKVCMGGDGMAEAADIVNISQNTNTGTIREIGEDVVDITKNTNTGTMRETGEDMVDITENTMSAIKSFKGLPHRLEYFTTKNDVRYYDDSISTIPEACINAVTSVDNTGTVIIGGMDRGIDYDILVDFIKNRKDVLFILCYATGERIAAELEKDGIMLTNDRNALKNDDVMLTDDENMSKNTDIMLTDNLDSAVKIAKERTKAGKACILSPAAPSYGYFKNFEERGDYFKELVNKK